MSYIKRMAEEGSISDPARLLTQKIKRYATTAENDSANLDMIYDAGEEVFGGSSAGETLDFEI